jgi:hypothetical protein
MLKRNLIFSSFGMLFVFWLFLYYVLFLAWVRPWAFDNIVSWIGVGILLSALTTPVLYGIRRRRRGNVVKKQTIVTISGSGITINNMSVDSYVRNVKQTVQSSSTLQTSDQDTLQELIDKLKTTLEPAAQKHPRDVGDAIRYAGDLAEELSQPKPRKHSLEVSIGGLKSAAKAVATIAPTVLSVAEEIAKFVVKFVS